MGNLSVQYNEWTIEEILPEQQKPQPKELFGNIKAERQLSIFGRESWYKSAGNVAYFCMDAAVSRH
jgi:hypothetical protein